MKQAVSITEQDRYHNRFKIHVDKHMDRKALEVSEQDDGKWN